MNLRNLSIIIVIALLVVIPQTLYVVDQTQIAIVTRFGEYQKTSSNPGLKFKTPFAEQVTKFDNRLLRVDAAPASILTADKRNLVIDSYARYRIVDPLQFYKSLRNEIGASSRVGDIVNAQLRQEVALDLQEEVISEKREDIMHRVTDASNRIEISREDVIKTYGLDQIRFFLFREVPFGNDGDFSQESISKRINADLSNNFGNLVQRVCSFIEKNCSNIVSNKFVFENDDEKLLNFSLEKISKYKDHMENQSIDKAIKESFELITEINVYIDNQTPWLLKKTNIERIVKSKTYEN